MDHVFLENALLVNISKFDFLTQTLVVDVLVAETSIHRVSIYSLYKHIYAFLIKKNNNNNKLRENVFNISCPNKKIY